MLTREYKVVIRKLIEEDYTQWAKLYKGYAEFYGVEQDDDMRDRVWAWIRDEYHSVQALVAQNADGDLIGLAHFRVFARPLSATLGGFLDDLFVTPASRGNGTGEALIEAVADYGREQGWSIIRWITADTNMAARRIYDRVATKTDWVTYDIKI
jgi:GNAT superfamily N-acetyltransferase